MIPPPAGGPLERLLLLLTIIVAGVVAWIGFRRGDRARRRAAGQAGPRPSPSIGEALEQAGPRGRVLVLFLDEDEASMEAARALAEDARVIAALGREGLKHVVVREAQMGREVAETLYTKYAGDSLPRGLVCLLLGAPRGERLEVASGAGRGPLLELLGAWAPPRS